MYPFVIERGEGCLVWDVDGNRYIDFHAGIAVCATGHSHPDVVRAIRTQAERFIHISSDFYHPLMVELAERLVEITPGDFEKRVFLCNSGTEAVEAAFKLARYATGRPRVIAFLGSFHGRTMGSLSLTGSKSSHRHRFAPLVPGVTHAPYAYCYRCPINLTYPSCDIACVDFIEKTLFEKIVPPGEVAAIFVEPIQGEGGYVVPPQEWLPRLRELCDRHGILLVADEVQTGVGRTGKGFAVEHWSVDASARSLAPGGASGTESRADASVVPDIVCIAKGIASGLPLGAMVAREDVVTWGPGAHGNTYGGNPLAAAAALETIRLVEEGLMENAAQLGAYALERLRRMQERHPAIGDVRGKGLMIGVELVEDDHEPAQELRDEVVLRAFRKGLLILGAGRNVIRIVPPLVIDRDTLDLGLDIFEDALAEAETP
jgi:4-aminobutyrate aminotransferase